MKQRVLKGLKMEQRVLKQSNLLNSPPFSQRNYENYMFFLVAKIVLFLTCQTVLKQSSITERKQNEVLFLMFYIIPKHSLFGLFPNFISKLFHFISFSDRSNVNNLSHSLNKHLRNINNRRNMEFFRFFRFEFLFFFNNF